MAENNESKLKTISFCIKVHSKFVLAKHRGLLYLLTTYITDESKFSVPVAFDPSTSVKHSLLYLSPK